MISKTELRGWGGAGWSRERLQGKVEPIAVEAHWCGVDIHTTVLCSVNDFYGHIQQLHCHEHDGDMCSKEKRKIFVYGGKKSNLYYISK